MNNMVFKKIKRYIEYFLTKITILFEQKHYFCEDVHVKYILKKKKKADSLVVVFSACTRPGLKARYNYVKSLDKFFCNRLYILDWWGEEGRGSYYLGNSGKYSEETATKSLIDKIISETKPDKVVFCGSSKGGYAAINFGIEYRNAYIISGGPQYYLSTYLSSFGNLLQYILGDVTKETFDSLEYRLKNKIQSNPYFDSQKWYIHYSNKEHTYDEHISSLIFDLESQNARITKDIADYSKHGDISYYFPSFLKSTIKQIIEE